MWKIKTPEIVFSGKGSVNNLVSILKDYNISNPLLVIDPNVLSSTFGSRFIHYLARISFSTFSDFTTNPTVDQVHNCFKMVNLRKCDSVIALGGGSAIDIAKAINLVISNGGTIEEYLNGKKITKPLLFFIAIPTTCGTGSESSPYAVISDLSTLKKRGVESPYLVPNIVILDVDSLASLDQLMMAATIIDTLAHVVEIHISKKSTTLTKLSSRGLLQSLKIPLEKGVVGLEESALEILQCIAFSARLLYPRTGLSIAHALSHPFGIQYNMHHGMAVALFLSSSLSFNLPYCMNSIEEIEQILDIKNVTIVKWIQNIVEQAGIASAINKKLYQKKLLIRTIAEESLQSSNIPSNPRPVSVEDAKSIICDSLNKIRFKAEVPAGISEKKRGPS